MDTQREESDKPFFAKYWWIIVVLVLLLVGFFPTLRPQNAFPAETSASDSVLTDCGTIWRTEVFSPDTTLVWIMREHHVRARPAFRLVAGIEVEIDKKFILVYDRNYVIKTATPTEVCVESPA